MRKLLANIATYGLGDLLVKATTFITLPIYTRLLSVADYGIWNLFLTISGLVFALIALGGDAVYRRFFFVSEDLAERQTITSTWIGFLGLWSVGFILFTLPFSNRLAAVLTEDTGQSLMVALTLLAIPASLVNSLCASALINEFRTKAAVGLNLITTVLLIVTNILGVLLFGVVGFFIAALVVNLIILPFRLWTIRHLLRFRFSGALLVEMLRFGLPIVPGSLAFWVFMSSDRILLIHLSDLQQVGLYAISNQLASLLNLVIGALQQAWTPQAIQIYETQPEQAPLVYGQVMSYILILFGVLSVGVTAFGREILMIFSSSAYYGAAPAIGPLTLGFLAYASAQITTLGIIVKKKTTYLAIFSWVAALVNLILNLIFMPRFGFMAAAWSTAAAYGVWTLCYLLISQRLFPVLYEVRRGLFSIVLTILFVVIAPLLPQVALIPSIVLKSSYCLIFIALLIFLRVIDRRELEAVSTTLRQFKLRVIAS